MESPADITTGTPGDAAAQKLELIDDTPDVVKMDLRKFNRAKQKVGIAVAAIKAITIINSKEGADKMMLLLKDGADVEKIIEAKRKALGDPYRLETLRINACAAEIVKDVAPAIIYGKGLILGFHQTEAAKAKKERGEARERNLREIGFVYFPADEHAMTLAYYWDAITETKVFGNEWLELSDEGWFLLLQRVTIAREAKRNETMSKLQTKLAGADFFGDEEAAAAVKEEIQEIKAAPAAAISYGGGGYSSAPATKGLTKRWVFEVTDPSGVPREFLQVDEKKIREAVAAGTRAISGIRIYQDESISLR